MKKALVVLVTVLMTLSLFISCGNDPFFHTVEFDSDGGTGVESQTLRDGEKAERPDNPTKDGYNFAGWYDGDDEFSFDTAITKDYKLKARWVSAKSYTVSFDVNGGTGTYEDQTVGEGGRATRPETDPVPADAVHYSFDCWTKEDGTAFDFDVDVITEDIMLVAKWKNRYAIGDTGPAGGTIIYVSSDTSLSWKYVELAPTSAGNDYYGNIGTGHYTYTGVDKEADNIALLKSWVPNSGVWTLVKNYKTTVDGVEYTDWTLPTKDQISQAEDYLKDNLGVAFRTSSTIDAYGTSTGKMDGRFWIFNGYTLDRDSSGGGNMAVYCTRRF